MPSFAVLKAHAYLTYDGLQALIEALRIQTLIIAPFSEPTRKIWRKTGLADQVFRLAPVVCPFPVRWREGWPTGQKDINHVNYLHPRHGYWNMTAGFILTAMLPYVPLHVRGKLFVERRELFALQCCGVHSDAFFASVRANGKLPASKATKDACARTGKVTGKLGGTTDAFFASVRANGKLPASQATKDACARTGKVTGKLGGTRTPPSKDGGRWHGGPVWIANLMVGKWNNTNKAKWMKAVELPNNIADRVNGAKYWKRDGDKITFYRCYLHTRGYIATPVCVPTKHPELLSQLIKDLGISS
ncbi:hypothetical protein TrRE_jg3663 [Triparma retinervis]|uniref:Uncharacterized protein n=1 Tax=Triparma retinervis TaxID=2557542 RepID=A0A9W7G3Q5_9STRA|nr:hypothetical protein TrRE_jg3663 [Triparma retinervis]